MPGRASVMDFGSGKATGLSASGLTQVSAREAKVDSAPPSCSAKWLRKANFSSQIDAAGSPEATLLVTTFEM